MKFLQLKLVALCALALACSSSAAFAQSFWNVASGAFDNPANWSPNGVPGAADEAVIDNGGTSIHSTGTIDFGPLSLASNDGTTGTLNITGGTLLPDIARIGERGTATATVSGGSLETGNLFVGGQDNFGVGTLNISGGAGTLVDSGDDIGVGRQGTGTLNMSGGELQGVYTFIGKFGTGTWNHSGGLFRQTGGDVEIGDGGKPTETDFSGPRTGTINLTGGVMQVWDSFCIGNRVGTGTVNISGGVLTVTGGDENNFNGNIYVGRGADWADEADGIGGPVELRVTGDDSTIIADGDFLMNVDNVASSSTLVAEITGATHTTIKVTGNANIANGKLKVDLTGYTPVSGNSWTILTAGADITADKAAVDLLVTGAGFDPLVHAPVGAVGSLMGTFASTDFSLAPLTAGLSWNVAYANNSVVLSVTGTAAFTADFDHNGQVNGADLAKWKLDYGVNANSDANGDGKSDGADFLIWQRQFGSGVPATAAIGAVPEPASIALIGLAAMGMAAYGRSPRNQA